MAHLPSYVRTHRKRLGLSQDEVAFLLGAASGTKVSRYESFTRTPGLETALAYEVITGRSVREIFAGLYERIEKDVAARARKLSQRIEGNQATRQGARKRQVLERIAAGQSFNRP